MTRTSGVLLIIALGASLPGCDEELVPPDSGAADLSVREAGGPDASTPDLAVADAGKANDASKDQDQPDAALPDTGQPDAGGGACAKVPVASKQALLKVIQSLIWTAYSPKAAGFIPLSGPLQVKGKISITYKDLKPPPGCTPSKVCFQKVLFTGGLSTGKLPPGVAFSGKSSQVPLTAHESITISNATVRLRAVVENIHPFTYNWAPILRVEPDCGVACAAGSQTCAKDKLCYASNRYCRLCLAVGHKQCACRKFSTIRADGNSCSYLSNTMSTLCQGQCKAGTCLYQGKPDVYCP